MTKWHHGLKENWCRTKNFCSHLASQIDNGIGRMLALGWKLAGYALVTVMAFSLLTCSMDPRWANQTVGPICARAQTGSSMIAFIQDLPNRSGSRPLQESCKGADKDGKPTCDSWGMTWRTQGMTIICQSYANDKSGCTILRPAQPFTAASCNIYAEHGVIVSKAFSEAKWE
jgi:hypothetical protein